MVADGLLALHEVTFDRRWLDEARRLAMAMLDLSGIRGRRGSSTRGAITRRWSSGPGASSIPRFSGSSVAADVLLRLAVLTGQQDLERHGVTTIRSVAPLMERYPSGFGRFLGALEFHLGSPVEVAVIWPPNGPENRGSLLAPLQAEIFRRYLPNRVVTGGVEGSGGDLPLLAGKRARGRATVYVCEGYACQAPTTEPAELGSQLDARGGRSRAAPVH
jgi:uncharacterized protein YyaL (SSP411 family)